MGRAWFIRDKKTNFICGFNWYLSEPGSNCSCTEYPSNDYVFTEAELDALLRKMAKIAGGRAFMDELGHPGAAEDREWLDYCLKELKRQTGEG